MANQKIELEKIGQVADPRLVQIMRATVKIAGTTGRYDGSVSLRPDPRGVLITADGGTVAAETLVAGHVSRPVSMRPADVTSALTGLTATTLDVVARENTIMLDRGAIQRRLVGPERAPLADKTADLVANSNELVTATLATKAFTTAATYVAGAAADAALPVMQQVQLQITDDAVVLRATDRFRLHTVPVPASTELVESWGDAPHGLPVKVAKAAGKILQGDQCTLTVHQYPEVDGKQVAVLASGKTVLRVLLNGDKTVRYEKIENQLIRSGGGPEVTVTVPGVALRRALKEVKHQGAPKRGRDHSQIYLEATGDGLGYGLYGKDGADVPLGKIEGPVTGPAGHRVVLTNAYLAAAVAGRKSVTLGLRGPNQMVTATDGLYQALVMAVRSE